MSCINLPHVALPDLSVLLPELPALPEIPHLGLSMCCELPELALRDPLLPPPLPPPVAVALALVMPAVMEAIDAINALIDQIPTKCPLE